jgi:small-conductance mechanosensitive channel
VKIVIFIFLVVFSLFAKEAKAELNNEQKQQQTQEVKVEYVKVSNVPEAASEVSLEIKKIKDNIKNKDELDDVIKSVKPYVNSINELLLSKEYENTDDLNARDLQKMQNELLIYKKQLDIWEELLKDKISLYEKNRKDLKQYINLWQSTNENAIKEKAPDVINKTIEAVMSSMKELDDSLKKQYDLVLTNSQIVTTNILKIKEMHDRLKKQELLVKNKIFYQNQAPFFSAFSFEKFDSAKYIASIKKTLHEKYEESIGYFQTHTDKMWIFAITGLLSSILVLYFSYLYSKRKLFISEESYNKKEFFYINKVFSTIFIILMLNLTLIFPEIPVAVTEFQVIAAIIPIMLILKIVVKKDYYKYMYLFFSIYLLFYINQNANNSDLESRTTLLVINIIVFAYFLFAMGTRTFILITNTLYEKIFKYVYVVAVVSLAVALYANLYGSVLLTTRIVNAILNSIYASFIFYVFYMILKGYSVIILRKRISSTSYTLEKYSTNIEKTMILFIKIWMVMWWLMILTKLIGIYEYLMAVKDDVLAASWEVGKIVISVQAIFDFLFVLVVTFVFAKLLRIFLELEIFSRIKLPRGMPTAILTTLNYLIIIGGTILAFSSLGVTTQQFALVIGALGVGIGFGLRNIIANFVSGIIMVFERPVQIGDTIEVDQTMGDVQSIGARSSTIKTFDGAEVIIPNADFIAKEIINWTLSDKQRRKTIEFKVALDNDIENILQIMTDIAMAHKDVLKDPEPQATFQGYGDYYLNFKLYFWLSDNIIVAKSELFIQIYETMKKSGVNMPIPLTEFKKKEKIVSS